jgi:hypothetical protein
MNEQNNYTYIKTIKELKQYIGKIIVCYYYRDHQKESMNDEVFDIDNKNRQIQFMWMFKLIKIQDNVITSFDVATPSVRHHTLISRNAIRLYQYDPLEREESKKPTIMYPYYNGNADTEASAQSYVRLATPQEIKLYLKLNRKKRIYGHN